MSDMYFDDGQEFYGYDGSGGVFGMGPGLDELMLLQGLFDTQLNRGAYNQSGNYQDPFTPHYQSMRHIANVLGKDWMEVLGLAPQEALPPPPMMRSNPYADMLGLNDPNNPFLAIMEGLERGVYTPVSAANRLKNLYEGADQATREQFRVYLPSNPDGVGVNWGAVSGMAKDYLMERSKIQREYNEELNEYNNLVASTPRYGFDETAGTEDYLMDYARRLNENDRSRLRANVRGEGRSAGRERNKTGKSSMDRFGDPEESGRRMIDTARKVAEAYGRELTPRGRQFTPDTAARLEAAMLASSLVQNVGSPSMGLQQLFSSLQQPQQPLSEEQKRKNKQQQDFQSNITRTFRRQ